ncbi:MAG: nucleotidyltransferase domain-containing protein [Phycisphaerae bacterium]|nr:nucleotidyltransferase domain-containing protein [Phycisphaerae bacterium]
MVSEAEKQIITTIARKHGAHRVLLFGSSAEAGRDAADIDIAVEGIPPREFFTFYGELMFALSKPVDVVDLSERSRFTDIIRREGVLLYG